MCRACSRDQFAITEPSPRAEWRCSAPCAFARPVCNHASYTPISLHKLSAVRIRMTSLQSLDEASATPMLSMCRAHSHDQSAITIFCLNFNGSKILCRAHSHDQSAITAFQQAQARPHLHPSHASRGANGQEFLQAEQ